MTWMRIRAELARSREFPEGSHRHGYEFVLPLDPAGRFDRKAYDRAPDVCTVHRFWEGGEDETGEIRHMGRNRWAFSYHADEPDAEPIAHFTDHVFREGEYLAVREPGGIEHTLRIVLVGPAPGLATRA